jgi:hypothetical protein
MVVGEKQDFNVSLLTFASAAFCIVGCAVFSYWITYQGTGSKGLAGIAMLSSAIFGGQQHI